MMHFSWPQLINNLVFKLRRFRYQTTGEESEHALTLTYLCPNAKKASGGVTVIYRHVSMINDMQMDGVRAQVFHPKDLSFRYEAPFANLSFKPNFVFNKTREVFVIHEMWAAREASIARDKGIRYIIQVQSGYDIFRKTDIDSVYSAYEYAELITCVSDDIYACLIFLFPEFEQKIYRLQLSVEAELFKPATHKDNIITYMPRKLEKHSTLVLNYIARKLPASWKIIAIHNMSQQAVAELLSKSKIFLSFSELEGLGLPPIEAALSGNAVIGYTGEAGKEYWLDGQFHEVSCGDIRKFSELILSKIQEIDNGHFDFSKIRQNIASLQNKYSKTKELAGLQGLVNQMIMGGKESANI
ncbi:glycosyltransferase [Methylophilus flavus]|uniref:Glycosyltransferase n=1 Tax=Methylophilus flavus TaxID=640084 RepID=A0ABW3PDA1_9PROT